uniref:Superoxide dismutase copper/zinc binding domain-containing protein n=1 Tax=Callorhinchus milii TaxID=7868 RepID=A0A4W3I900_CALMI
PLSYIIQILHLNRQLITEIPYSVYHFFHPFTPMKSGPRYGICSFEPNRTLTSGQLNIIGYILFKQDEAKNKVKGFFSLDGFPKVTSVHAIHIHQFGDLTYGCKSTSKHFNPYNVKHPNHPGDFPNLETKHGKIRELLHNLRVTMYGPDSILGLGIVLHEGKDDLGKGGNPESLIHGNSGKALACCTIAIKNCENVFPN